MQNYHFNEEGYFVIESYDEAKTFSSFLPGIAGKMGVPMWSFYVNRGQAMVSFGVKDKNHAITEFFPANQAYQRVATNGFRTFIKLNQKHIFEPFSSTSTTHKRKMFIKENELKIEEINTEFKLKTIVTYFTLPNENFAALIRKVEVENLSNESIQIEVIDGLPAIIPFGVDDAAYKAVGNTLKSWMDVFNREDQIPYYRVRSSTNDTAEVEEITKGHFYLSFIEDGNLLLPIVDANLVFGTNTAWSFPNAFREESIQELLKKNQLTANKVPSGFSGFSSTLKKEEVVTLHTMIGHVNDIDIINKRANELSSKKYMERKYKEAVTLVNGITQDVATKTAIPLFDAYCKQSYLDNILRGGYPIFLETEEKDKKFVYYIYSRKHGDLERDYNFFSLVPEFYSQGNGNFRDVNQNRRNDVYFHPEVGDYNIKLFMSLIQIDGYNPLVVKGSSFELKEPTNVDWIHSVIPSKEEAQFVQTKLSGKFTPGDLLQTINDKEIELTIPLEELLKKVLTKSEQHMEAEFGEGYWIDHWTYNLDLIQNYLSIYPDRQQSLLFDEKEYLFFSSPAFVKPRSEKFVLNNGSVRQYNALEESHTSTSSWLVTKNGEKYKTTLFSKLFILAVTKFSSLDPLGLGIEMEANKPGWNDSMNGLPGVFGSAMSETFELKRVLDFLVEHSQAYSIDISLPNEVVTLTKEIVSAVEKLSNGQLSDFHYWDMVSTARENYRLQVKETISGDETVLSTQELSQVLSQFANKVNIGIEKANSIGEGLPLTYLYYEADDFEVTGEVNEKGLPLVHVKSFKLATLPHYLEGPARALKTIKHQDEAVSIHEQVKNSALFDQDLKMYKTSVSIENETFEIGRARAFTPGWLERESIFMHMEFKYLLSMLKVGLYDEFFEDLKTALPPFMDPETYGRSVLENSSFIASSVNPDPSVHGQGFVARLSGTTAEFLSIWQKMMMGKQVFSLENEKLSLTLQPILPEWLFDENDQVSFMFLGEIKVTYHNPSRKATFGFDAATVSKYVVHAGDKNYEIHSTRLEEEYALKIRNKEIKEIDVYLD
ncbi:cellobiose phosphorylase [Metabacillus sp. HB246100]